MNFCQNCGTKLDKDAKFCTNCGQAVKKVDDVAQAVETFYPHDGEMKAIPVEKDISKSEKKNKADEKVQKIENLEWANKLSYFIAWLKNNYIIAIFWIIVEIILWDNFVSSAFWIITLLLGAGIYVYSDKYNSGITGTQRGFKKQLNKLQEKAPEKKEQAKALTEKMIAKSEVKPLLQKTTESVQAQPVKQIIAPKSMDAVSVLLALIIFGTSYVGPYFSAELLGMSMGTTLYDILKLVDHTSTLFVLGAGPVVILVGALIKSRGLTFVGTLVNGGCYAYFASDLYNLVGTGFSNSYASAEPGASMLIAGGVSVTVAIWALIMLLAGLGKRA